MTNEEVIKIFKRKIEVMDSNAICCNFGNDKEAFLIAIKALEQQKTGKWIYKKELRDESLPYGQQFKYECSICEFPSKTNVFNFCPNCGAKMEEE